MEVQKNMKSTNIINSSRRGFLKTFGAAALGGISALTLPSYSRAGLKSSALSSTKKIMPLKKLTGETYWQQVRSNFTLAENISYLNTGTEGSMPESVLASHISHLKKFASSPMYCIGYDEDLSQQQKKNRKIVAQFMGADPVEIVLTTNTTEGLHLALNGLDYNPGDEVITTLHDHNSGISALYLLRERRGVVLKELALPSPANNKDEIIEIFKRAITSKTKVLSICHVNYTTGLRMPVKELSELARSKGIITIVDGAHALGMLDFDFHDLGCDFYACSGHKWLNGPPGTGILYIRNAKENPHKLWPAMTEVYDNPSSKLLVSGMLQMRGQQNTPALSAMADAVKFQEEIGKNKIQQRVLELNNYLKEKIIAQWGHDRLLSPTGNNDLCSGLASFMPFKNFNDRYKEKKNLQITKILKNEHNTYIRAVKFKNREKDRYKTQALRISTHIFNTRQQIDIILDNMKKITETI